MEKEILRMVPLQRYEPEIGRWLWAIQDARHRTVDTLEGLDDRVMNWVPDGANSIGTLLYHIAAIEMDWLYVDVLEGVDFPPEIGRLLAYDVRDDQGRLAPVPGETLDHHLHRLDQARRRFLAAFEGMTLEEFRRPRHFEAYDVTPEWIVHHLMQHEAEHRGQIGEIRAMAQHAWNGEDSG